MTRIARALSLALILPGISFLSAHGADDSDTIASGRDIASSGNILAGIGNTTSSSAKGALILSAGTLSITEGRTGIFTVKIDTKPYENVSVSLTNKNPEITYSPTSLTFDSSNWNVMQTVTVSVAHDSDYRGEYDIITLTASGGGGLYTSVKANKPVSVTDDDTGVRPPAYLILSTTSLSLDAEDDRTASFKVGLRTQPGEDVLVSLTNTNSDVGFSPTSFTFTPSQWTAWQVVTVSAKTDGSHTHSTDTIVLGASGDDDYDGVTASVSITIPDDLAWWYGKPLGLSTTSLTLEEGGTGTFTVRFERQLYLGASISLTNTNSDIVVSPKSLNFSALNWNVAQTVTLTVAHDSDTGDDIDTISFRDPSGSRLSQRTSITVLDDDNERGLPVLSRTSLSIDEGSSGTFTVKLDRQPRTGSSVSLANTNPDITVSPTSLTFTSSNWNAAQSVTVSAAQDDDITDDTDTIAVSTIGFDPKTIKVSVKDDKVIAPIKPIEPEPGEIILSPAGTLVIDEGSRKALEVKLGIRPSADVRLTLTNTNPDITPSPALLTFTASNWNVAQSVSVAAALDDDDADDTDTLTLSASGGGYEGVTATKSISVIDIDSEGGLPELLVLSRTSLSIDEGGSGTFTVKLDKRLGVTISVSIGNTNPDITTAPTSLTFTASNWNVAQSVTVSAARDEDDTLDTDTITLSTDHFAPGIVGVSVKEVEAPVPVEPEPGEIILSPSGTLVIDEGSSKTVQVKLGTRPSADVSLTLANANPDITPSPALLTFTASNWNVAQSVSVAAALDDDDADDTDTLTLSASGGGYEKVTATKAISVIDIDSEGGLPELLVLSRTSLNLDEGGSETFTVKLERQPGADIPVSIGSTNPDITVSPASLTFTASNWNAAQSVTVSAARDEDDKDDTDTLTLSTAGFAPKTIKVSVRDDKAPAPIEPIEPGEIILSPSGTLVIDEGGRKAIAVRIGTRPSADVTLTLTNENPDITPSPALLTFTASNWNISQSVSITAALDDDDADDTDTLTLGASGGGYDESEPATKAIIVIDIDSEDEGGLLEILVLSRTSLNIDEGGSGTFTLRLDRQPVADVPVFLSRSNRDIEISPSGPLAFTASNWSTEQTVTVKAKNDADTEDDFGAVILKATGGGVAATETLSIVITDRTVISPEETGTLRLSPGTLVIDEGGQGTFTVALGVLPSAAVTVSLAGTNPDIALSSTSLSFDARNWDVAKTVVVRAAHDDDDTDDADTITVIASGGNYQGVRGGKSLVVADDDIEGGIPELVLSTRVLRIREGSSNAFTLRLDKRPGKALHLSLSSTNPDITLSPSRLTFTPANWIDRQSVVGSARQDSDSRYDIGTVIMSAKSDSRGFVDLPDTILVFVDDITIPDSPTKTGRLNLSARTLAIREGESGTFEIALGVRPVVDVRVSLTGTNPDIALSPAVPLLFTTSNWSTAQAVTVKAMHDADAEDESDTITVSASGGNYDEVTAGKSVVVADDDIEGGIPDTVVLSTPSLRVDEGGSKRFSVRLGIPPSRSARIFSVKPDADADITVSPLFLSFTDSNWNEWQSFTVNALQDRDGTDDVALVVLKTFGGIVATTKTILVTMVDRIADTPPPKTGTLSLSAGPLEIEEGASGSFTVALGVRPSADVSVSLSNGNPDITLSPKGPLSFTASNWNTAQTITATAADDDDARDDIDSVRLDASGGNYEGVSADHPMTVIDDDIDEGEGGTPGIVLSSASLGVARGGSKAFTVELDARPSQALALFLTTSAAGITVSPSSLTFTDSNWNAAQTVTVTVARGGDVPGGTITLSASGLASRTLAVRVSDEPSGPSIAPEEIAGVLVPSTKMLSIGEGESGMFEVGLAIPPSRTVTISIDSDNPAMEIDEDRLYFTPSNWSAPQAVTVAAKVDEDEVDDTAVITLAARGGNYDGARAKVIVDVMDDEEPAAPPSVDLPVKAQALALPPPAVQDSATMRVRCRSGTSPCIVRFDCTAQDGTVLTGVLPWMIPALGSVSFDSTEIADIVGASWEGKGRLGCELQSDAKLGSQVWTRSGNGVLVNNSAAIRSRQEGTGYRADIESIPSPGGSEKSNVRIRCLAPPGVSCSQVRLACFDDTGAEHPGTLDPIPSRSVRHLQTQDIADIIRHRWEGMGLSCELRSNQPFTAQVLTRTGGGGALVNNSATGVE